MKNAFWIMLASQLAMADDGTWVYQSGDVAFVFPWKLCLIVSAGISAVFYFARK